jgi:ribonuclease J
MGAQVLYEKVSDIHTSGHAKRGELKLMLNIVRPRYFIPVHGEYRHLVKHAQLAVEMGIPPEKAIVAEDGDVIVFDHKGARIEGPVEKGRVLVDGKGVGDIGATVLRDRRRLSSHGVVIILLALDKGTYETVYGPDVISRGFVFEEIGQFLLEDSKCIILEVLDDLDRENRPCLKEIENEIEKRLKKFFYSILERRPIIVPIIIGI